VLTADVKTASSKTTLSPTLYVFKNPITTTIKLIVCNLQRYSLQQKAITSAIKLTTTPTTLAQLL